MPTRVGVPVQKKGAQRDQVLHLLEHELADGAELSREAVQRVAQATGVPEADIWGAGRFYTLIARSQAGARLCQGLSCMMAGAEAMGAELDAEGIRHERVSCLGQCDRAPVAVGPDLRVNRFGAAQGALTPADPILPMNLAGEDTATYAALARARELGPEGVLAELEASGLQGRGGAGFPAALKWKSVRGQAETERYVICNADEAEPGTFKDRELMRRRPHLLLEGLAIAAFTAEAKVIYIYVRGEFPEERAAVEQALAEAGPLLADFEWRFVAGHGAYICGEETALLESIEGRRGMPRLKPPYPTEQGLFGKPTLMNNVETLACVPDIVLRGGARFKGLGRTEPGTKLYCISGHIVHPGVYELPLGVSLDEVVAAAGGYVGTPRAFSPGGASSGFLPMSMREVALDFRGLPRVGSMLGSAGVVVLNDTVDMALAARWQQVFFEDESCGQCAPCRIGSRVVRRALDRYLEQGDPAAFAHLDDVGWEMEEGSICGLGMVAALPLAMARKHFPEDFGPR